jgi:arabinogalactan endo-1,4-beta-galactosidase
MRVFLAVFGAVLAPLHAAPWFDGGDLSALGRIEQLGGRFTDREGRQTDAINALASFGANIVRLRLFVEPDGKGFTNNDLPYTLALAKRAKAAGQTILLDFHYSDTWADPGKQGIPKSWPQHDLDALAATIESYTHGTLRAFDQAGVPPELVQIGNEIDNGLLWPAGKVWKGEGRADWDSLAVLLKAASRGVRRATPVGKSIRIVLHTATGGNAGKTATFHRELQQRGLDYDVAGLSYYPWWHGTLDGLAANCRQLATTFGKEVLVVEAGFGWREGSGKPDGKIADFQWPITPAGQSDFLRDVIRVVRETPGGKGIGVIWWHPDSIPVAGANVWRGGRCALWQPDGTPLPALSRFSTY